MKEKLFLFDTTLRDGDQQPGNRILLKNKIKVARSLDDLNIDVMEVGFGANSREEVQTIASIARLIRRPVICSLARATDEDIDAAWEAVKDAEHARIHVFLSSSDIHLLFQLRRGRREVLEMARAGVVRARCYTSDVEFSAMDASRTDPKFIYEIVEAVIDAGATTVNLPDTVGYADPDEYRDLIRNVRNPANVPNIGKAIISVHCHNDQGLAVANSLAGVKAGARQVEATINGIGERAGNAAMEEIIMAIKNRADIYPVYTDAYTPMIARTSSVVERWSKIRKQPNKAIVGTNAFAHESGIHLDGILKERITYEIMDPAVVGVQRDGKLIPTIGRTTGSRGVRAKFAELGYTLSDDGFNKIFPIIKRSLVDRRLNDRELSQIAEDHGFRIDN